MKQGIVRRQEINFPEMSSNDGDVENVKNASSGHLNTPPSCSNATRRDAVKSVTLGDLSNLQRTRNHRLNFEYEPFFELSGFIDRNLPNIQNGGATIIPLEVLDQTWDKLEKNTDPNGLW